MKIKKSIIHGILKCKETSGAESVETKPRNSLLTVDDRLDGLCKDVLSLYGKLSNGYGVLGGDEEIHRFPRYLRSYLSEKIEFIDFSLRTIAVLSESMSQQRFATTSYPIFFMYENQGRDWILIAVLKLKQNVGIDEKTLDLNDSLTFDIGNLREAARIDIARWKKISSHICHLLSVGLDQILSHPNILKMHCHAWSIRMLHIIPMWRLRRLTIIVKNKIMIQKSGSYSVKRCLNTARRKSNWMSL